MLTKVELEIFSFIARSCCTAGLVPYDWDSQNYFLLPTKSKRKLRIVKMNAIITFIHSAFVLWRLPATIAEYREGHGSLLPILVHGHYFLASIAVPVFHINLHHFNAEMAILTNQTLYFNKDAGSS